MTWASKYKIGDSVRYTEPSGFTWDAIVTEATTTYIQVKWCRNRETNSEWEKYSRAYELSWDRLWGESRLNHI